MRDLFDLAGIDRDGDEIIVDLFAGGGGASEGIRMALGRDPEAAVNHNPKAVAMHKANHPDTEHFTEDVWNISPSWVTQGRPVGLLWASPDCTHFSKAKGGAPVRNDRIRSLAMVLVDKWIPEVRPRVIIMENVEEMTTWGPLDCRGRVIDAAKGDTFRMFINRMRRQGYKVQYRELRACDYGAPTIRKRLFLIARCDGQPITWPEPTHGDPNSEAVQSGKLLPWRTAAECIDWSIPAPSIFDTSAEIKAKYGVNAKRPLAEKTMKRIAEGIRRYVLEAEEPFVVDFITGAGGREAQCPPMRVDKPLRTASTKADKWLVAPHLSEFANASNQRNFDATAPLRTQCAQVKGGHFYLTAPSIQKMRGGAVGHDMNTPMHTVTAGGKAKRMSTGNPLALTVPCLQAFYGGKGSRALRLPDLKEPMRTVSTENRFGLACAAFLAKHFGGVVGAPLEQPAPTVTTVDHNAVVASNLVKMRGTNVGQPTDQPLATVSAGGNHHAEVRAFLMKYYSEGGQDQAADDPMHTLTTKARMGLVTIAGQDYIITDIGMRMLQPRELYRAQGFPDSYIIGDDPGQGLTMTKTDQVKMCGNSVCPPMAAALVRANVPEMARETAEVAA